MWLMLAAKKIPLLGPILSGAMVASLLLSDASKEEKVKGVGGLIGGGLGAAGFGMVGGALGSFPPFIPFGGPIIGGILGSLVGWMGGEWAGQKLAGFLMGEEASAEELLPSSEASMGGMSEAELKSGYGAEHRAATKKNPYPHVPPSVRQSPPIMSIDDFGIPMNLSTGASPTGTGMPMSMPSGSDPTGVNKATDSANAATPTNLSTGASPTGKGKSGVASSGLAKKLAEIQAKRKALQSKRKTLGGGRGLSKEMQEAMGGRYPSMDGQTNIVDAKGQASLAQGKIESANLMRQENEIKLMMDAGKSSSADGKGGTTVVNNVSAPQNSSVTTTGRSGSNTIKNNKYGRLNINLPGSGLDM